MHRYIIILTDPHGACFGTRICEVIQMIIIVDVNFILTLTIILNDKNLCRLILTDPHGACPGTRICEVIQMIIIVDVNFILTLTIVYGYYRTGRASGRSRARRLLCLAAGVIDIN